MYISIFECQNKKPHHFITCLLCCNPFFQPVCPVHVLFDFICFFNFASSFIKYLTHLSSYIYLMEFNIVNIQKKNYLMECKIVKIQFLKINKGF